MTSKASSSSELLKKESKVQNNMAEKCNDRSCPNHGSLSLRGRIFTGIVVAEKMQKTVVVEWEWKKYVTKFERYEKKTTTLKAHNPGCIDAKKGDIVKIAECRPLSKTKHFVIIEKLGKERLFAEKEELMEAAKVKKKKKEESEDVEEEK